MTAGSRDRESLHDVATGQHLAFLPPGRDNGGALLQVEVRLEPGGRVPRHAHVRQDERIEVVDGSVVVRVGRVERTLHAGDAIDVPRRVLHLVRNDGTIDARFILDVRPARRMQQAMRALFMASRTWSALTGFRPGRVRPKPSKPGRRATRTLRVVPSAAVVVLGTLVVVGAWSALELRDPLDHATGHAIAGMAAGALFVLAVRYWPPPGPRAVARAARFILAAGFAVFAVAQAVEGVGAFDIDGGRAVPWLDDLHGAAMYPGTLGVLLTTFGALSSLLTVVAARYDLLDSRWMLIALVVPVTAVALFIIGAFVFGY